MVLDQQRRRHRGAGQVHHVGVVGEHQHLACGRDLRQRPQCRLRTRVVQVEQQVVGDER